MQSDFFSPEEQAYQLKQLDDFWTQAEHWYHFNNQWDLFFKVALLAISLFSVLAAGTIATKYKEAAAPWWLAVFNASAAALVTALSAFAFTTINFAARARTYEIKRNEFGAISGEVRLLNPNKTIVLQKLQIVHSWGDNNPAPTGGLPKAGPPLSAATGAPASPPPGAVAPATASPGPSR